MTAATATAPHWSAFAACKGVDDDVTFPASGAPDRVEAGKALCASCPVQQPCLDEAMAIEEGHGASRRFGISGGLSGYERWQLERRRNGLPDKPEPRTKGSRPRTACGEPGAIARHRRLKEAICDTCRAAETAREEKKESVS